MEKNNIAWVVVRALGVYLAAQVFIHLYNLSALFLGLSRLYEIAESREEAELEIIRTWVDVSIIGIQFLILLFLAYYCLRRGALIHKLLMFRRGDEKT
jgi:hypothetical protein